MRIGDCSGLLRKPTIVRAECEGLPPVLIALRALRMLHALKVMLVVREL
jgi:hypothetical protein